MGLCGRMPHGLRGTMRVATLVVLAALWAPAPTLGVAAHGARGDNLGGRHAAAEPAPSPVPPSPAPHREECCWCDRDTHNAHRVTVDADGAEHELVFSDEFSTPGRDFANGNDKRWTALNKSDYTNASPVRYTPDAVTTVSDRGAMVLVNRTDNSETRVFQAYARPVNAMRIETKRITDKAYAKAVDKTFTSGMVQSWDKFCFTGGVIEVSAKFPMGLGFWPAIWLFGNLGRAIHGAANDGLWPYSFEGCDPVWEAKPMDRPGLPQRISGCNASAGAGLHPYQGRGATEIDLIEVGDSWNGANGYVMQSLQVAPSVPAHFRPTLHEAPRGYAQSPEDGVVRWKKPKGGSSKDTWYRGLTFGGNNSDVPAVLPNAHWYGANFADSITAGVSPFSDLSEVYRVFRLEWDDDDTKGYLRFFIDGSFIFKIPASSLDKYTVCSQTPDDEIQPECDHCPKRKMPSEPATIVLNTALGSWNGGPDSTNGHLPGHMFIDYVRVWQKKDRTNVGCNPPNYPTREYIDANSELYGDPALPRGYDSCAQKYPPPTPRPLKPNGGGGGKQELPRQAGKTRWIGIAILGIGVLGIAVVVTAAAGAVWRRAGPSQNGEADERSAGTSLLAQPILGTKSETSLAAARLND